MSHGWSISVQRHGALALLGCILLAGPSVAAEPTTAHVPIGAVATASAFLDTMGVSVHWEQLNGVYGHRSALVNSIARLGIKHIRGFDSGISPKLAQQGVTSMLVAGPEMGTPDAVLSFLRRANANRMTIDAVEGPNEPDLFWPLHGYSYRGQGFPAGVLAYQRDLYAAFKAAPGQSKILIIGPSLGKTYNPSVGLSNPLGPGTLTGAVDLGNFHPYPFGGNSFSVPFPYDGIARYYWNGNFPSVNIDEFPYEQDVYGPPFKPRPMAATETGYPTWRNGVSETVQAIYLPRLFAEYFRIGIRRTYLYEFADNQPDPSGLTMDDHFGLLHNDLTPKPAFKALQSLILLLRSGTPDAVVSSPPVVNVTAHMPLGYDRVGFVHSLLLRMSETQSLLLIWHEIANADTASTPPRMIKVPDGSLDIEAAAPYRLDAWYGFGDDWQLHRHARGGQAMTVPLQDRIVLVSLLSMSGSP